MPRYTNIRFLSLLIIKWKAGFNPSGVTSIKIENISISKSNQFFRSAEAHAVALAIDNNFLILVSREQIEICGYIVKRDLKICPGYIPFQRDVDIDQQEIFIFNHSLEFVDRYICICDLILIWLRASILLITSD